MGAFTKIKILKNIAQNAPLFKKILSIECLKSRLEKTPSYKR